MRTVRHLLLAASLVLAWSGPASAQPQDPEDEARRKEGAELVDQGIELYKAKRFAEALPKFEAAYHLTSAWQVLVHIGMTQRRLRHYRQALGSLERYLGEGGDQVSESDRKLVEGEIALIRSLVGEVRVEVKLVGNVEVYVNDQLVGTTPLEPILLDPGTYTIRVQKAGAVDSTEIEIHAGESRAIELNPLAPVGYLEIHSTPAGARLRINGTLVGVTPREQSIAAGHHRVEAMLKGYVSQRKDIEVVPGKRLELFFDLDLPWYRKWQYWTAIGASVVTITAGVLIVREITDVNLDYAIHYPPNP